jgi:predicted transcriptional regulator
METSPHVRYLLWFLFNASKGGANRIKIISKLRVTPLNANQLSIELGLNYKAIQHHLRILERNNLVLRIGGRYGATFFISPLLEVNMGTFERLIVESQEREKIAPQILRR